MSTTGSSELSSPPSSPPTHVTSTSAVSFDPKFYPHLFDIILAQLNIEELIPLRSVCHFARDKVDQKLSEHVVMATVKNRVVACLPTSPPRPVPKTNFWQTNLKNSIRIVDYPAGDIRSDAYPRWLSQLCVDTIRTRGCLPQGTPIPTTREWTSRPNGRLDVDDHIEQIAADQVTLILNRRREFNGGYSLPLRGLKIVVIVNGNWWTVNHGNHECPCGDGCLAACNGDCEDCFEARDDAIQTLDELAAFLALQILHCPRPEQQTFTLVDMDRWTHNCAIFSEGYSQEGGRKRFLHIVKLVMGHQRGKFNASNFKFMSREEYRDSIGIDRFNLQTRVGYDVN